MQLMLDEGEGDASGNTGPPPSSCRAAPAQLRFWVQGLVWGLM